MRGLLLLFVAACAASPPPVASPARRYPVPPDVGRLVLDEAAFAELARPLRADLERDLVRGIADPARWKDVRFELAILDGLDGRFDAAVAALDEIVARETAPAARIMTGLTIRVWADAIRAGGDPRAAFRAALERRVTAMPYEVVSEQLAMLRAMGQTFTPEVCRGLIDEHLGPAARSGAISLEDTQAVVFQRWAVVRLAPVGDVIDEVVGRVIEAR